MATLPEPMPGSIPPVAPLVGVSKPLPAFNSVCVLISYEAAGTFTVTHPFHPLGGLRFEAVETQVCWGGERVFFIGADGRLERLRACWTSLSAPDPLVEMSVGRSPCRVRDLLALPDLTASLSESGA